jgi:hypothetical protein
MGKTEEEIEGMNLAGVVIKLQQMNADGFLSLILCQSSFKGPGRRILNAYRLLRAQIPVSMQPTAKYLNITLLAESTLGYAKQILGQLEDMNQIGTRLMRAVHDYVNFTISDLQTLIAAGANVNARNQHGQTPLSFALALNAADRIQALIDAKADVNARLAAGHTVLMQAASTALIGDVRVLVINRADVNARSHSGLTPLMCAARNGHREVTQYLWEASADVDATDETGTGAFMMAAMAGHQAVADFLLGAMGAKRSHN